MIQLISGALFAGYTIAGLFFLRFWASSRDRLFAMFALAFWILAVQRVALVLTRTLLEDQAPLYLLRLLAFVIIIVAVVDKNRR
ncbi:MAG: DUF5985 family protein [Acidobacteriota bacterium]|nr:DUF5985 family protein [Acidobacteriota bacterium]